MKKLKIFLIIISLVLIMPHKAYSKDDKDLYYKAKNLASQGQLDFAFVYFDMLLRTYPESKFAEAALFAIGEYYFSSGNISGTQKAFGQFLVDYPESTAKLFALVYLFKTAEQKAKKELAQDLKKQIISYKQISLLFRDFEEFEYSSALSQNYKAIYFIDKIQIFIDEDLFAEIPF